MSLRKKKQMAKLRSFELNYFSLFFTAVVEKVNRIQTLALKTHFYFIFKEK